MKWILAVTLMTSFAYAQKGEQVVAIVGNKKITLNEFNKKYAEVKSQASINVPPRKVFLEDLVRYELGLQEARKRGLEKDPLVMERINQEIYKGLLEKELGQKVQENTVSEKEMREYYAKNPQIRVSDILIELKPGATEQQKEEAKKRATEILSEVLKSKRPFDELARLYSDDLTTKNMGGDIGWQSSISLVPPYYQAVLSLKLNEIGSNLVETPFGFHIIKLTGKRSYEEATKRDIRMAVFDQKRKAVFDQFFDKLKKSYKIDVNPKLVE
ncbi:MAG: peptidylprolyl isomerase [Pseudobdellovibrio sp.]